MVLIVSRSEAKLVRLNLTIQSNAQDAQTLTYTDSHAEVVHDVGTARVAIEHQSWGRLEGLVDAEVIKLEQIAKRSPGRQVQWTLTMRRTSCGVGVVMQGVEERCCGMKREMFMCLGQDDPLLEDYLTSSAPELTTPQAGGCPA